MSKTISVTQSVCPVCLRVVEARRTVGEDGNIYLQKSCPEHGNFSVLIWEGTPEEYLAWGENDRGGGRVTKPVPAKDGCPRNCGLCTEHRTNGCCVLLELTNRCNMRCPVCFARAGEAEPRDVPFSELALQYDLLMERGGPFNIQLSGGEPTLRDDLPEIIQMGRRRVLRFFSSIQTACALPGSRATPRS